MSKICQIILWGDIRVTARSREVFCWDFFMRRLSSRAGAKFYAELFYEKSHDFSLFSTQLTLFRPKNSIGLKKDSIHVRENVKNLRNHVLGRRFHIETKPWQTFHCVFEQKFLLNRWWKMKRTHSKSTHMPHTHPTAPFCPPLQRGYQVTHLSIRCFECSLLMLLYCARHRGWFSGIFVSGQKHVATKTSVTKLIY